MSRTRRHQRITQLIAREPVRSQDELRRLLAGEGIEATQATLSRDLRELGVVKAPGGYQLPGESALPNGQEPDDMLRRILRREMVGADCGGNLLVLRTAPGHANALAVELDRARPPEILGTIAGDDTVFVAARTAARAQSLFRRLRFLAGE